MNKTVFGLQVVLVVLIVFIIGIAVGRRQARTHVLRVFGSYQAAVNGLARAGGALVAAPVPPDLPEALQKQVQMQHAVASSIAAEANSTSNCLASQQARPRACLRGFRRGLGMSMDTFLAIAENLRDTAASLAKLPTPPVALIASTLSLEMAMRHMYLLIVT